MGAQPPPCSKHTMVAQGSRLFVALGEVARDRVFVYDTSNHAWLQAEAATDAPAPLLSRSAGVLIGDEMITFGGIDEDAHASSDALHVLDVPTMSWHNLTPGGFTPTARMGCAACALGASMYIFGGVDADGYSATFVRYDASAMVWESPQLDGAAPGARVGHTMTTARNGWVYAYGGASGGRPLGDIFVLDLARSYWERATVQDPRAEAPPSKVGHACVHIEVSTQGQLAKDSQAYVGEKLLCFGGGDGRRATNETLLIDLPSLSTVRLEPRGRPPQERVGHAMALVRSSLVYVFGGFVRKLGYMFDVHCLDLGRAEWRQIQVGGTVPDGRINHTLCAHGRTLYLFGGAFKGNPFGEVYTLSTDEHRWERVSTAGLTPEPRSSHTAEMVGYRMFVFGGIGSTTALGDLLIFDTRTSMWSRPRTSVPPRPRGNHAAAAVGERLVIFGGSNGGAFYRDCVVLDTASRSTKSPLPSTLGRARADGDTAAVVAHASDAQPGVCALYQLRSCCTLQSCSTPWRLAVHLAFRISLAPLPFRQLCWTPLAGGLATPRSKLQVSSAGSLLVALQRNQPV